MNKNTQNNSTAHNNWRKLETAKAQHPSTHNLTHAPLPWPGSAYNQANQTTTINSRRRSPSFCISCICDPNQPECYIWDTMHGTSPAGTILLTTTMPRRTDGQEDFDAAVGYAWHGSNHDG